MGYKKPQFKGILQNIFKISLKYRYNNAYTLLIISVFDTVLVVTNRTINHGSGGSGGSLRRAESHVIASEPTIADRPPMPTRADADRALPSARSAEQIVSTNISRRSSEGYPNGLSPGGGGLGGMSSGRMQSNRSTGPAVEPMAGRGNNSGMSQREYGGPGIVRSSKANGVNGRPAGE
jgi:hypothetical protein